MRVPERNAITDLWNWRDAARSQPTDLVGFQVVATDGTIGNLDAATYDVGGSYIVVDTGFWIFGKKRLLPAGVIDRIDYDARKIHVNLTKDQIREAPDYDTEREREEAYRQDIGAYYGPYFGF
jgi:PRC-barrel domain